ncbi:MAG: hypothetical protein QNJ09_15180 [Paracoccaceae bacterium]|nr:hypothetical protein [Paracoccaceae bacterium]
MNVIAAFSRFCLIATLVVTSGAMAAARGQAGPVGSIEICHGATVTIVYIDAEGQPVEQLHLCPDYALTHFGSDGPGHLEVLAPQGPAVPVGGTHTASMASGQTHLPPSARGPPERV